MNTLLVIDMMNVAYRLAHAMRDGNGEDNTTYGFLRYLYRWRESMAGGDCVFCFDEGESVRKCLLEDYKRKPLPAALDEFRSKVRSDCLRQLKHLKESLLPQIGFVNLFSQEGYEADDVIASVCLNHPKEQKIIVVSTDEDLYQLIDRGRVVIYDHANKQFVDEAMFGDRYGIHPRNWPDVKAIAGDTSDNIKGVHRIGEKTAIKWLRGEVEKGDAYNRLMADDGKTHERNLLLVKLPYPGTRLFPVKDDKVTLASWNLSMKRLGFDDLIQDNWGKQRRGFKQRLREQDEAKAQGEVMPWRDEEE